MSPTPTKKSPELSKFFTTHEDVGYIVKEFINLIRDVRTEVAADVSGLRSEMESFSEKLKSALQEDSSTHKDNLLLLISDAIERIDERLSVIRNGIDGQNGVNGETPIKGVHYFDGVDGSPDTGEEILAKIHETENLIDVSKIDGIEELLKSLLPSVTEDGKTKVGWGAHPLRIENTSAAAIEKVARTIRFKGNGVSVSRTKDGVVVVDVAGGSGSASTPTGTVNGSNTVFGVASQPAHVVADGITYYEGVGYSYAALNITMDVPPSQYIRYYA